MLLGTGTVAIIYLALNVVYLYALSIEQMSGVLKVGESAVHALFEGRATGFLNVLFMASILGSVSAMVMAGPRVYFAMGRDGLFPRLVGRVHPRLGSPANAILLQAALASLLVLSGTFAQLVTFSGVVVLTFSGWTVASLFVLRRRYGHVSSYRAWGYPWTPAIFLGVTGWSVLITIVLRPTESLAGLALCALGIPFYFLFRRTRGSGGG